MSPMKFRSHGLKYHRTAIPAYQTRANTDPPPDSKITIQTAIPLAVILSVLVISLGILLIFRQRVKLLRDRERVEQICRILRWRRKTKDKNRTVPTGTSRPTRSYTSPKHPFWSSSDSQRRASSSLRRFKDVSGFSTPRRQSFYGSPYARYRGDVPGRYVMTSPLASFHGRSRSWAGPRGRSTRGIRDPFGIDAARGGPVPPWRRDHAMPEDPNPFQPPPPPVKLDEEPDPLFDDTAFPRRPEPDLYSLAGAWDEGDGLEYPENSGHGAGHSRERSRKKNKEKMKGPQAPLEGCNWGRGGPPVGDNAV